MADSRWVMAGYMLSAIGYQLSTEPSERAGLADAEWLMAQAEWDRG